MAYVSFPYEGENPDDLLAVALERIAAALPGWTPNEAHVEYAVLSEMTREAAETRLLASDVADEVFRTYGEKLIGLPAQPGIAASGTATFTMTDTTARTVPAGTQVLWPSGGDPILFATVNAVSNVAGNATTPNVQIVAAEPGTFANGLATATALELVDALSFVQSAQSTSASSGGQDPETDTAYLDRLTDSLRLLRRIPVLAEDFAILARDVVGVYRALALDGLVPGTNEQQDVTVSSATGGTFTLTFEGQTTAAIAHNATATQVRDALVALSNVGVDDVLVTGGPLSTAAVRVEFTGFLGASDRTQMTATSSLTGTGAAVAVATARAGVANVTNAERTLAVAAVDSAGQPVSAAVLNALQTRLDSEREVNFVVTTLAPTYTTLTVTFTARTVKNGDPAAVRAAAEAAVKNYLSPAHWGGGAERPPVWRFKPTVRYLDVVGVIARTPGVAELTAVSLNGGTADVTLAGAAPLPAANPAVTGTVTLP